MYRKFKIVVLSLLVHITPLIFFSRIARSEALVYKSRSPRLLTNHIFFRGAVLRKLFDIRFSYKHCNFSHICLLVKMASKTVTRSIAFVQKWNEWFIYIFSILHRFFRLSSDLQSLPVRFRKGHWPYHVTAPRSEQVVSSHKLHERSMSAVSMIFSLQHCFTMWKNCTFHFRLRKHQMKSTTLKLVDLILWS